MAPSQTYWGSEERLIWDVSKGSSAVLNPEFYSCLLYMVQHAALTVVVEPHENGKGAVRARDGGRATGTDVCPLELDSMSVLVQLSLVQMEDDGHNEMQFAFHSGNTG